LIGYIGSQLTRTVEIQPILREGVLEYRELLAAALAESKTF